MEHIRKFSKRLSLPQRDLRRKEELCNSNRKHNHRPSQRRRSEFRASLTASSKWSRSKLTKTLVQVGARNDKHTLLNTRMTRVDGPLKVTGAARYTYDQRLPGMLYGRILPFPHAHARVTRIDTDAALKIPGVKSIVQAPLAEVRFVGAPVAAVAATTPEIAGDALRAIKVTYEVLPHVVHADEAIKLSRPKSRRRRKQRSGEKQKRRSAKSRSRFATADEIVEAEYISARIHHACLETHGMVVDYRGGDSATIYASTQGTFTIPADAAKELGLEQSKVVSSVEHMGGGFGSKFGIGTEGMFACRLSKEN